MEDPSRWIRKVGVPIFKAHERKDPATGQLIKVDLPKLYRIAANMQRLEREGGVPIRMTLGHTEPNKSEPEQPPVGGYYKNARVQPFGPKGEPAVVVDEWLDPQYAPVRKNFPYRSAEYYDDAEQITGVALLTRDPFLDLGVVAYERGDPTMYGNDPKVQRMCREFIDQGNKSSLLHYTADSKPDRRINYAKNGRKPVLYHMTLGEVPVAENVQTGQAQGTVPALPAPTPYAGGQWPWHSEHTRANIGQQHSSQFLYDGRGGSQGRGAPAMNGRNQGRGRPGRYAEEGPMGPPPGGPSDMGGGPPGGGDPLQQLQMLLMGAVEVLGQMTGEGGAPPGPPQEPFPPSEPDGDEQYARYAAQTRQRQYANQGQRRPAGRSGYGRTPGRYEGEEAPVNYGQPRPTPYGATPAPQQPVRTISGKPVGEASTVGQLTYQVNQLNQVVRHLAYERDAADTQACAAEIQRLADNGYPVGEYELGELKAKNRDQRGAYIEHIVTRYAKIGTEQMPQILGDPTPSGPDPRAGAPLSKEEMDAAIKLAATMPGDNHTAYSRALEQVRYGRTNGGTQYGRAGYPQQAPQGPNDQQQGPGFNPNPYGNA